MTKKQDLTHVVDRLESFEDRLGIEIRSVSAYFEDDGEDQFVTVRGEVFSANGSLEHDMEVKAAAFDTQGRIVGTSGYRFWSQEFLGVDSFELFFDVDAPVVRIRLQPGR